MGAAQSLDSNLWNSTFQTESKNSKLGIIRLTDKQTDSAFICRKISTLDKTQIQQMQRLIDIKLSLQSPYLAKLQKAQTQPHQDYCAYGNNFYLLFKQPFQTLKQQTLNRKFKSSLYSEAEIEVMLETGVKALSFLKNIGHPHQNISSSSFFVQQNRSMILGDPWMFPKQTTLKMMRNGFIYPSPEVIKYQNGEINLYNPYLSDLFTLGLVLLEVFYMVNMDCVYERCFEQVNYEAIWFKLNPIKNQQLKKRLFTLLDPEPRNREIIFKHYMKPMNSFELFNQKTKENFKKNIDRYNLATSQVTEWKNQINFEPRLNSSDGQKTFSVSTTQNLHNQDRGYNYYEREYGQNQGYSSKQNVGPSVKNEGMSQGAFGRQMIREPAYQTNEYSNFRLNQPQRIEFQGQSSQTVFKTGSSRVKFTNSNVSIQNYTPAPQNYSFASQNFTPSYHPSYQHFSIFNLPQTPTYTPSYSFNSNPIFNQTPTFSHHIEQPQTSSLPSYTSLNAQEIKLPSPPTFSFASSYEPAKSQEPLIESSVSILNTVESVSSEMIQKACLPVVGMESKSSKNQETESSQTSIMFQKQRQQKQAEILQIGQSNQGEQIEKKQSKKSPIIVQSKSESLTPSVKKHKKNPSDYNKYQHLSTINERSQMTDSLVSQKDQKRSDILIQEDEQNQQDHREIMSEDQNTPPLPQQNKIWSIVYPSGTKYIGETKNDKRNGLGTFFYIDGSKYHGHWLDNKMNGFGTLFYPNGKIAYEGEWKMDNFHGRGKVFNDEIASFQEPYHYQDCMDIDNHWLYYDGQLFEDRKQGKGILKLVNGQWFEGTFVNDELHGPCKFYTLDKKCIEGIWQNSKLVKIVSEQEEIPQKECQQKE